MFSLDVVAAHRKQVMQQLKTTLSFFFLYRRTNQALISKIYLIRLPTFIFLIPFFFYTRFSLWSLVLELKSLFSWHKIWIFKIRHLSRSKITIFLVYKQYLQTFVLTSLNENNIQANFFFNRIFQWKCLKLSNKWS